MVIRREGTTAGDRGVGEDEGSGGRVSRQKVSMGS